MTRDGDPFFASDGRPEASVDPVYPGDDDDRKAIAAAWAAGHREGQFAGFRTGMLMFSARPRSDRDLMLTAAAVRLLMHPETETVTAMARTMEVSRKTLYQRIAKLRAQLPFLGNTRHRVKKGVPG